MEIITQSAKETQKLAADLIKKITEKRVKRPLVLGLQGELGSGKTTFIQGLAEELKIKERVLSPTFIILKKFTIYDLRFTKKKFKSFYHVDCYRIERSDELEELGFKEILKKPENIIVIEWAEKIKEILPKATLWLEFEHLGEDTRRFMIYDL